MIVVRTVSHVAAGALAALVTLSVAMIAPGAEGAPHAHGGSAPPLALAVRTTPPPPVPPMHPMVFEMLDLVNAERSVRGLAPMQLDERIVSAAQRHAEDQADRMQMGHIGSDGSTMGVRVRTAGYDWRSVAENVAYGQRDIGAVLAAWMASPAHRRNILSGNVHVGIGLAYGADGRPYWTQVFASPA